MLVDVKGGQITYGQRIELGKILGSESSDVEKFEKAIKCLYGLTPSPKNYKKHIAAFNDCVEGVMHWIKLESENLNYKPTAEEERAGIKELSSNIGEFGTVKALAKAYSIDPDEILKWKYGKVYGILATDLLEYKFQQKLNNIISEKYK